MTTTRELLWAAAQRAWDEGRDPLDDPQVADVLLEQPELLAELDRARHALHAVATGAATAQGAAVATGGAIAQGAAVAAGGAIAQGAAVATGGLVAQGDTIAPAVARGRPHPSRDAVRRWAAAALLLGALAALLQHTPASAARGDVAPGAPLADADALPIPAALPVALARPRVLSFRMSVRTERPEGTSVTVNEDGELTHRHLTRARRPLAAARSTAPAGSGQPGADGTPPNNGPRTHAILVAWNQTWTRP